MKLLFKIVLIIVQLSFFISSEILEIGQNKGQYKKQNQIDKDANRYYLCGGQLDQIKTYRNHQAKCTTICLKSVLGICVMSVPKCTSAYNQILSLKRTFFQGIFCRIDNHLDRKKLSQGFKTQRLGQLRICPKNQYIYGMRGQIDSDQDLVGLILFCKNPFNPKQKTDMVVGEGISGKWMAIQKSQDKFVYSFKVKKIREQQITGLSFKFQKITVISNIGWDYKNISNYQLKQQIVDTLDQIINTQGRTLYRTIKIDQKNADFMWLVDAQSQHLSPKLIQSKNYKQIIQFNSLFPDNLVQALNEKNLQFQNLLQFQKVLESFIFDKKYSVDLQTQQSSQRLAIPNCSSVKFTLFREQAHLTIPFQLTIVYENDKKQQKVTIYGKLKGRYITKYKIHRNITKSC